MGKRPRVTAGGLVYHVLNRAHGRRTVFESEGDYAAFERAMADTAAQVPMRLLAWCIMPNHCHLVLWPEADDALSVFVGGLTLKHVQRRHAWLGSAGEGSPYAGRFRSFVVESDGHLLTVLRYVERNALRAGLVDRAEAWPWGSLAARLGRPPPVPLTSPPVALPADWCARVNAAETAAELDALRASARSGRPLDPKSLPNQPARPGGWGGRSDRPARRWPGSQGPVPGTVPGHA